MKFTKKQFQKNCKDAYDYAWRKEPLWENRAVAGRIARRAVRQLMERLENQ